MTVAGASPSTWQQRDPRRRPCREFCDLRLAVCEQLLGRTRGRYIHFSIVPTLDLHPVTTAGQCAESLADYDFFPWWQADLDTWRADPPGALMGLGERAKPSNSSVSTTRIRPISGPHWPWMLLQALSAHRSGPRLQHLVQLHIRTDCGPQGHQLKNPVSYTHLTLPTICSV